MVAAEVVEPQGLWRLLYLSRSRMVANGSREGGERYVKRSCYAVGGGGFSERQIGRRHGVYFW